MKAPVAKEPAVDQFRVRAAEWREAMARGRKPGASTTEARERWVCELGAPDAEVRLRAVSRSRSYGTEAVSALCTALQDPDLRVRTAAAELLGELGDECALRPLMEALRDSFEYRSARMSLLVGVGAVFGMVGLLLLALLAVLLTKTVNPVTGWAEYVGQVWKHRNKHTDLVRAITDAIEQLGQRSRTPELRGVLPDLRVVATDVLRQSAGTRAASRQAIARIEALTATLRDLPVPAAARSGAAEALPVSAEAGEVPDGTLEK